MRNRGQHGAAGVAVLVGGLALQGAPDAAELKCRVLDEDKRPFPGAVVQLNDCGRQEGQVRQTGKTGLATFDNLQAPREYCLEIAVPGYRTIRDKIVVSDPGQRLSADHQLTAIPFAEVLPAEESGLRNACISDLVPACKAGQPGLGGTVTRDGAQVAFFTCSGPRYCHSRIEKATGEPLSELLIDGETRRVWIGGSEIGAARIPEEELQRILKSLSGPETDLAGNLYAVLSDMGVTHPATICLAAHSQLYENRKP